jgi:FemAB-related protein (PEP-CTERM system-associated)
MNVLTVSRSLSVRLLEDTEGGAWDEFVFRHPRGTPFHLMAWRKSIEEVFRYRPYYLVAVEREEVKGVLPLFLIENILVGKALLSIPFAVYGGVLADSPEVQMALKEKLQDLAESQAVEYVELRNAYPEQTFGFAAVTRYVTFTQTIGTDETAMLDSIPRKTRAMVRKALKQGFVTKICQNGSKQFEDLYSRSLRRLATPSFPPSFFAALIRNFGSAVDIRELVLDGKVASAVLSFYFRDQVLPYYGASDPALNAAAPNNAMYFDLMCWAGRNGYRTFDFGRSKKNLGGSYDFKSHWGMVERPLPYEMLLVKRRALPNYSPANPIFQVPQKIWQHLPLALTRKLGPMFLRLVP